ncbi:MAG: hypothetical protein NC299_09050 [Lachnospiraceae bacterium]|nr:hypothetical protein [Lachnospiraceae bacterium]
MEIKDKWVVHERRDDVYFTGMGEGDYPVLERLNSRVRTYKSERSAKMAINRIGEREYCEFRAVYIKCEDVPDVPADTVPEETPPKLAEVGDPSGWEAVFACAKPPTLTEEIERLPVKFAKIALCRKVIANKEIFGVSTADGKLYSAGIGGGEAALRFFLEEYYNYLLPRVTE